MGAAGSPQALAEIYLDVSEQWGELGFMQTLIIVTMDHGQLAKNTVYEGGTRVALMARYPGAIPAGSTATVVVRVVGRNTGGPLATLTLPVADGSVFPLEYSVTRGDLREGLPDYIWEAEDIYVKADLTAPSGKEFAVGRGKSKFKDNEHQISYVLLE